MRDDADISLEVHERENRISKLYYAVALNILAAHGKMDAPKLCDAIAQRLGATLPTPLTVKEDLRCLEVDFVSRMFQLSIDGKVRVTGGGKKAACLSITKRGRRALPSLTAQFDENERRMLGLSLDGIAPTALTPAPT